jgi:hypothetical protein
MARRERRRPAGAGQVPYLPPDFEPGTHMILLEGETDTMAAWQAAPPEARKGIVGLSGTGSWKKAVTERGGLDELFGKAKVVWVVFDNDDPYKNADGRGERRARLAGDQGRPRAARRSASRSRRGSTTSRSSSSSTTGPRSASCCRRR